MSYFLSLLSAVVVGLSLSSVTLTDLTGAGQALPQMSLTLGLTDASHRQSGVGSFGKKTVEVRSPSHDSISPDLLLVKLTLIMWGRCRHNPKL